MKRGQLVTVALQGDLGKPRPALVIQSDLFAEHGSVVILPVTSELRDTPLFRITIAPSARNGLKKTSQVMVDKPQSVARDKVRAPIGALDAAAMLAIDRAMMVFLGLA